MDDSYLRASLLAPSLHMLGSSVETSSGEGSHAQHVPRPGQVTDTDTLPAPSTTYPAMYPPAQYHSLPCPPGPRPSLAHGLIDPRGGGAFRPVGEAATTERNGEGNGCNDNAFLPTKRSKVTSAEALAAEYGRDTECGEMDSGMDRRGEGGDGTCGHTDRQVDGRHEDRDISDEVHKTRRLRKKSSLEGQTTCCPVCGVTIRSGEIGTHLALEVERLNKINRCSKKCSSKDAASHGRKQNSSTPSTSRKESPAQPLEGASQSSRYDTYQRVRGNRQLRLNAKRGNKKRRNLEETMCPICSEKLTGTAEELNGHVELCLKKRSENDEVESVDIEGDDDVYEEYTWAGQTRIRATSMLPGGLAASGFITANKAEDEDGDLNVDEDDEDLYGAAQYPYHVPSEPSLREELYTLTTNDNMAAYAPSSKSRYNEADIIPCSSDEPSEERERRALRGAYLQAEGSSPQQLEATKWTALPGGSCENTDVDSQDLENKVSSGDPGRFPEIIESLKAKIKDQEEMLKKGERMKCLICMESYTNPLTSIQCWHVHCQECWLRTLGAKKLCPQCNSITSPTDLRKIYL